MAANLKTIIKEELEAIQRLQAKDVTYMELQESEFRCGQCIFANQEGYCKNKKIMAMVNLKKGCCNLYKPRQQDEVSPDNWVANKK